MRASEESPNASAPPKADSLADIAARLSRLEGIVEQLNQRLTNLEARVDSGFRWMIGIQVTTLLTLGTLILVKLGLGAPVPPVAQRASFSPLPVEEGSRVRVAAVHVIALTSSDPIIEFN